MHPQKRTVTIRYELTKYQANQLRTLGRALWPGHNLHRDEICRRVLLEGADRMLATSRSDRLLEACCLPKPKA